jgi:hypothetical protein
VTDKQEEKKYEKNKLYQKLKNISQDEMDFIIKSVYSLSHCADKPLNDAIKKKDQKLRNIDLDKCIPFTDFTLSNNSQITEDMVTLTHKKNFKISFTYHRGTIQDGMFLYVNGKLYKYISGNPSYYLKITKSSKKNQINLEQIKIESLHLYVTKVIRIQIIKINPE